jgi:cytochrome c oxidase subunit 2
MANGSGTGRITAPGVALGGLLLILILVSIWLFTVDEYWFPSLASIHGAAVDQVFVAVLVATGIAFIAVQGLLGYFVLRYGSGGDGDRAGYWHDNPKAEAILIGITALTLTVLVFMGQRVWADIYFADPPEDALIIEVTGQQFQWVVRYPGPDGVFGLLDASLVSDTNFIGLDRSDAAGMDDIMTLNDMHVVVDQPVRVQIRSTDVIHDFHLPNFRVKQDAVPGMTVESRFTPTETGTFEIACAELCGLGHYRMKGMLTVDATEADLQQWFEEQLQFQGADD